jgi:predicted nuclease with RNAse H fold
MNYLGVDVGFAASSLTTGLAWRVGDQVGVTKTGTSWKERREALPAGIAFSIAALDAPILPAHEAQPYRGCESVFLRWPVLEPVSPGT